MGFSRQEYWSGVPLPSLTINPSWALFHRHASFLPLLSLQIIFASFYSEKRSHQTTNSLCFLPPAQQHALSALIFSALPPVIMELLSWLILSLVLDRMLSLSPRNFIFFFSVISFHILKPLPPCYSFPTSFKYNQVCSIKNRVLVAQSCLTLCDPMDCSPTRLSIHGFPRQEYWSGLPCASPGDLPDPGIKPRSSA